MNEIIKAMEERRSIRKFKPDMPTKEDLEQIIEAGLYFLYVFTGLVN